MYLKLNEIPMSFNFPVVYISSIINVYHWEIEIQRDLVQFEIHKSYFYGSYYFVYDPHCIKVKVKQSHYRLEQAHRIPGSYGSQIS